MDCLLTTVFIGYFTDWIKLVIINTILTIMTVVFLRATSRKYCTIIKTMYDLLEKWFALWISCERHPSDMNIADLPCSWNVLLFRFWSPGFRLFNTFRLFYLILKVRARFFDFRFICAHQTRFPLREAVSFRLFDAHSVGPIWKWTLNRENNSYFYREISPTRHNLHPWFVLHNFSSQISVSV